MGGMREDMEQQATSVLARIAKATLDVGSIAKDKTNKHDGYQYLSEEAVKQAVQKVIGAHNIPPKHIGLELLSDTYVTTRNGGQMNLIKVRCRLEWEDGSSCEGLGSGQDYGDKALMKAQTVAVREAWKNRLTISTGDDSEGDPAGDERTGPTREERMQNGNDTRREQPAQQQQQRSAPQRQQQGNGNPADAAMVIRFGDFKDMRIDDPEVPDREIRYLIKAAERSLSDPGKSKYHATERLRLRALQSEIAQRESGGGQDAAPPPSDDDFPDSYRR